MRLLLLPVVVLILIFACATGEAPGTAEPEGPVAEAEPPEQSQGPEEEAAEAPEGPGVASDPESSEPGTPEVAAGTPPEEPAIPQGSADTSTATSIHGEGEAPARPVSAPVVSEPWNYGEEPPPIPGVIDNADVVAFYGHPLSFYMGILGENPIEEMAEQLRVVAGEYDAVNGRRTVAPAFHIIYATAYADANVGVLNSEVLAEYIEFAEENDLVVILDHQLGKHDVVESVRQMLPYLHYDSVHLAIDPEWSTLTPNDVIGSVHAEEINRAQQLIQDYLEDEGINQRKMFIVHQFNWVMIEDRPAVRSDFERVDLVLNASGFGPPGDKTKTWDYLRAATNIPLKGFKLFYPKDWRDGGYDDPLMTPEEVLALEPRPVLIMYQ